MMYKSAIEQIKDMKNNNYVPFRLAKVTSLSDGRAYVNFYGESTASSKLYPYIEGYKPKVDDDVLMIEQGSTFIIMGKVSKDNITDNYYLLKSAADAVYLTQAVADTLYQPIGSSSNPEEIENENYSFGFISSTSKVINGNDIQLGSTGTPIPEGYFSTLGGPSSASAIQLLRAKNFYLYGDLCSDIIPSQTNTWSLGSSTYKFKNLYVENFAPTKISAAKWQPNTSYSQGIDATANSNGATFTPSQTGKTHLGTSSYQFGDAYFKDGYIPKIHFGTYSPYLEFKYSNSNSVSAVPSGNKIADLGSSSYQFKNVYANQFYQNGTAISTSDRRKKTGIKDFTKKYIEFFKKLKPKLFRFKDGESGRLHSGFIAQDVEDAAAESGIPTKDLAFLCIDEDGNYGLRYEELIALQTKVIQDLMARVDALEEKIKGGK